VGANRNPARRSVISFFQLGMMVSPHAGLIPATRSISISERPRLRSWSSIRAVSIYGGAIYILNGFAEQDFSGNRARGAGASIKPRVERGFASGTLGSRNPVIIEAREAGDSGGIDINAGRRVE
jgi:hypothetical protein